MDKPQFCLSCTPQFCLSCTSVLLWTKRFFWLMLNNSVRVLDSGTLSRLRPGTEFFIPSWKWMRTLLANFLLCVLLCTLFNKSPLPQVRAHNLNDPLAHWNLVFNKSFIYIISPSYNSFSSELIGRNHSVI